MVLVDSEYTMVHFWNQPSLPLLQIKVIIKSYTLYNMLLFHTGMLEVSEEQEQKNNDAATSGNSSSTRGRSRRGVVVVDNSQDGDESANKSGCCGS